MRAISFLIFLSAAVLIASCLPSTFPCDELQQGDLSTINYYLIKDSTLYIFNNDSSRNTLKVISVSTGQPVPHAFNKQVSAGDTTFLGGFAIYDPAANAKARDAVACSEYILKYGTSYVDTLKVCLKLSYSKKCNVSDIDSAAVYLDGRAAPQPPKGLPWDFAVYLKK